MANGDATIRRNRRSPAWAVAALAAGAVAIAFAAIFVKISPVGPSATGFWRLAIALPVLSAGLLVRRRTDGPPSPVPGPSAWWLLLPGVFFAGDLAFWHEALARTSAANATLLANFAPVFVALTGWLWLKERLRASFLVGLVLALAGATAVIGVSFRTDLTAGLGDLLGVATAVFYAAYQVAVKRLRGRFSALAVITATSAVGAGVLLAVAVAGRERLVAASPTGWATLVALAIICQVIGQGMIIWAVAHLPVSFSSVSLLLQPVVAALLAWQFLGEHIGALQFAGGALVLTGIYFARRGSLPTASIPGEAPNAPP